MTRPSAPAKVVAIVADGELREEIPAGTEAIIVLDRTVLYAEMGGQVADYGCMKADGVFFEVDNVQKTRAASSCITASLPAATSSLATS